MLYDPKWEQKTKKPSLAGMVAWLETQDPQKAYMWYGCEPCLIEQYCYSLGLSKADIYGQGRPNLYDRLVTNQCIARGEPHTFGAALERARKAMADNAPPSGWGL